MALNSCRSSQMPLLLKTAITETSLAARRPSRPVDGNGTKAGAAGWPHSHTPVKLIGRLLCEFYGPVRRDERLGPISAAVVQGDWEPRLEKTPDVWCPAIRKIGIVLSIACAVFGMFMACESPHSLPGQTSHSRPPGRRSAGRARPTHPGLFSASVGTP